MIVEVSSVSGRVQHETKTVGTTRAQLADPGVPLARGVTIKADTGNADVVYVGGPEVTDDAGAHAGYPLAADESLFIAVKNPAQVYVVGGAASQKFAVIGI